MSDDYLSKWCADNDAFQAMSRKILEDVGRKSSTRDALQQLWEYHQNVIFDVHPDPHLSYQAVGRVLLYITHLESELKNVRAHLYNAEAVIDHLTQGKEYE